MDQQPQIQQKKEELYIEKLLNLKQRQMNGSLISNLNLKTSAQEEVKNYSLNAYNKYNVFKNNDAKVLEPIKKPKILKKIKKLEEAKTLGQKWEGMKQQDITPEVKQQMAMLNLRQFLNPKQFYKSSELKKVPKYFQIGTVVPSATDYLDKGGNDDHTGKNHKFKMQKKKQKKNIIDQFLSEDDKNKFSRKKFLEIQENKKKIIQNSKLRRLKKFSKRKFYGKKR